MRILHRPAAVVLAIVAIVIVAELIHAAVSGNDLRVVNFVAYVVGAGLVLVLALFMWRSPKA